MHGPINGRTLLAAYAALCLFPLALALLPPSPAPRAFGVELGVALGFVGLSMMCVQFVLTARFGALSARIGQDTLLQFHRYAGIAAALFVYAHPAALIIADPGFASFFDPRVNFMRAAALSSACAALALVILLSVFRARLRIDYEWWRLTHGLLASFVLLVSMAHVVMVGHYASPWPRAAAMLLFIAAPLALLAFVRIARPLAARKRPYRVAAVRPERPRTWTLTLEPEGHDSFPFVPGQFAWVTFSDSPLGLRRHPFTIASSAERLRTLEFTIKELGDFTATIGSVPIGSRAFVEGPAGAFRLPEDAPGALLIAGGIGITPMMSILRTMRDRADTRPVTLIYATKTIERRAFDAELDELASTLSLRVVAVPEKPPEGWTGPSGYLDRPMLESILTADERRRAHALICGPDPMMNAAEEALLQLGFDRRRIRSERFNVV